MRPFNLKEPFLKDLYSGAQGALNDALATGAFTGPTYAGLDPMQMRGITGMGAFGDRALGLGSSFMDTGQGFAQNAQNSSTEQGPNSRRCGQLRIQQPTGTVADRSSNARQHSSSRRTDAPRYRQVRIRHRQHQLIESRCLKHWRREPTMTAVQT